MNSNHHPTDPLQELAQSTAIPFEQAQAMPKSAYTSELFLQQELDTRRASHGVEQELLQRAIATTQDSL